MKKMSPFDTPMHQPRTYRQHITSDHLVSFGVRVRETDLWVQAKAPLEVQTRERVLKYRAHIESYIESRPEFAKSHAPIAQSGFAPPIVSDMINAGIAANVGPMAAVAGAVAEYVGRDLLEISDEIVVENGGDLFIRLNRPFVFAVDAGKSPLSMRVGLRLDCGLSPVALCTSSGSMGHSFSRGRADAACVVSPSGAVADAAATAVCNRVGSEKDIATAIEFGKTIDGVTAIVVIIGDRMGLWGNAELVPLSN